MFEERDDTSTEELQQRKESLNKLLKKSSSAVHQHNKAADDRVAAVAVKQEQMEEQVSKNNDCSAKTSSPSELTYTGNVTMPITTHLHIVTPEEDPPRGIWPVFRLMVSTQVVVVGGRPSQIVVWDAVSCRIKKCI
jgi:hypothetical protein